MKRNICISLLSALLMLAMANCAQAQKTQDNGNLSTGNTAEVPTVYMFREITSDNLVKIYEALGREAKGKVAVKLSTGEPGGHNFLDPPTDKGSRAEGKRHHCGM